MLSYSAFIIIKKIQFAHKFNVEKAICNFATKEQLNKRVREGHNNNQTHVQTHKNKEKKKTKQYISEVIVFNLWNPFNF